MLAELEEFGEIEIQAPVLDDLEDTPEEEEGSTKADLEEEEPAPVVAESEEEPEDDDSEEEGVPPMQADLLGDLPPPEKKKRKRAPKDATTLVAQVLIGIGNKPYVRGTGPGLSPDKGVPMEFVEIGKWQWVAAQSDEPVVCQIYKVFIRQ